MAHAPPHYWGARCDRGGGMSGGGGGGGGGATRRVDVTGEMKSRIEWVMNESANPSVHGRGRDSHDIRFDRFVVTRVELVENVRLWRRYAT